MPAQADSVLREGTVVEGRLRLERLLGRGAAGSVWLATHLALSSPVAIKFLDQLARTLPDADELEHYIDRFRFEAQVSARLSSGTRHIVACHDAGAFEGIPYLVMEYAPGRTLEDVLEASRTLPDAELLRVSAQIAEALAAAHRLGIVHRDVKAANILCVEREGEPTLYKLADFGLARVTGERPLDLPAPKRTAEGIIVGTPAYMSPEQIAAEGDYGPATDLWSLAVVLFEAKMGYLPFEGGSLTELALSISSRAHPSLLHTPDVRARALDSFFSRALAKRPELRFSSAAEMAAAFEATLNESASSTPDVATPPSRRPWPLLAAAALAFGLLGVGGLWLSRARSASSAEPSRGTVDAEPPSPSAHSTRNEPEVAPEPRVPSPSAVPSAPRPTRIERAPPPVAPTARPSSTPTSAEPTSAPAPAPTPTLLPRRPIDKSEIQ